MKPNESNRDYTCIVNNGKFYKAMKYIINTDMNTKHIEGRAFNFKIPISILSSPCINQWDTLTRIGAAWILCVTSQDPAP